MRPIAPRYKVVASTRRVTKQVKVRVKRGNSEIVIAIKIN